MACCGPAPDESCSHSAAGPLAASEERSWCMPALGHHVHVPMWQPPVQVHLQSASSLLHLQKSCNVAAWSPPAGCELSSVSAKEPRHGCLVAVKSGLGGLSSHQLPKWTTCCYASAWRKPDMIFPNMHDLARCFSTTSGDVVLAQHGAASFGPGTRPSDRRHAAHSRFHHTEALARCISCLVPEHASAARLATTSDLLD